MQVKWGLDEQLIATDPDKIGYQAAIRRVLEHRSLRDKFNGVREELSDEYSTIIIGEEGLEFIRRPDSFELGEVHKNESGDQL